MNTPPTNFEPLPACAGSLTVDQMAAEMGLECCDFTAERPNDCDICGQAAQGEHIWVKMAGAYEGSSVYACSECVAVKHAKEWSSENDQAERQEMRRQ